MTSAEKTVNKKPLLEISGLKTVFPTDDGIVNAVNDVSFKIARGQTVGVVGESGCGKSITGLSLLQLVPSPGRIEAGEIQFYRNGEDDPLDIAQVSPKSELMRQIRGNEIAIIFQEPMTSLNPVYTVGNQIAEAIILHEQVNKKTARERAIEMIARVGIPAPTQRVDEYPHQLSGGMRQRVMIAMALCCSPTLLIADEPTTALDVTIQAQILDLMRDLQDEFQMSIMLITHDLGVVAEMSDEVAVMYMGRIVEHAATEEIFENPKHPYTQALMQSIPGMTRARKTRLQTIRGSVPDPYTQLQGCPFHPRCEVAQDGVCNAGDRPELLAVGDGHAVACVLYE